MSTQAETQTRTRTRIAAATVLLVLAVLPAVSFAGGNTSVVKLDRIETIEIDEENEKITITGTGMIVRRVISDREHGDSTVFGQPAQLLHARANDATFEIVPYFVTDESEEFDGVPSAPSEEARELSEKWWGWTLETARNLKPGDAVTIGYQSERLTIRGFVVTAITGAGSLTEQVGTETSADE